MACTPIPQDDDFYHILIFPRAKVGVDGDRRRLAIMLQTVGTPGPYPTILCTEREAADLILQLQGALKVLSRLPLAAEEVPYD